MSNSISLSKEAVTTYQPQQEPKKARKRSLPGNPDPDAEVISLSPRTLLATNRFVCEICKKGFQRDQNLQLHRRGHNLPWKLKQRSNKEVKKKAYVCPEPNCVHHNPSRALGDLTGIKKHFCRKHGEKKFKCQKCSKIYAVHSDWKAHSKTCGTREYRCDCGTLFSRKDSFITHRAFCDALAEESARLAAETNALTPSNQPLPPHRPQNPPPLLFHFSSTNHRRDMDPSAPLTNIPFTSAWDPPSLATDYATCEDNKSLVATSPFAMSRHASIGTKLSDSATSATALLQRACTMGAVTSSVGGIEPLIQIDTEMAQPPPPDQYMGLRWTPGDLAKWRSSDHLTRDFLGLAGHHQYSASGGVDGGCSDGAQVGISMNDMLTYTEGLDYADCTTTVSLCDGDYPLKHQQSFGLAPLETWGDA